MKQLRGGTHTTLTETAKSVVQVLEKIGGVSKISPGIITQNGGRSGKSYVTAVFTNAGLELIITGQGVQKVAIHCQKCDRLQIFNKLRLDKRMAGINFKTRDRQPGI
jgi:hypothetical protein